MGQLQALLSAAKTVLLRACVELADWQGPQTLYRYRLLYCASDASSSTISYLKSRGKSQEPAILTIKLKAMLMFLSLKFHDTLMVPDTLKPLIYWSN